MKKIGLIVPILLVFSFSTKAAMTGIDGGSTAIGNRGDYNLVVTCTFDATPATATATLPSSISDILNSPTGPAKYVYAFQTVPGSTGPKINSDLAITDSNGATILSATGNGQDVVDKTTVTSVIYGDGPTPGSTNHYPKANGLTWTITVTNNDVASSSFSLIMQVGP